MRNGSETMEQHGSELNDQNQSEEENKNQTDWLKLQIFFCDVNLKVVLKMFVIHKEEKKNTLEKCLEIQKF